MLGHLHADRIGDANDRTVHGIGIAAAAASSNAGVSKNPKYWVHEKRKISGILFLSTYASHWKVFGGFANCHGGLLLWIRPLNFGDRDKKIPSDRFVGMCEIVLVFKNFAYYSGFCSGSTLESN